MADLPGQEPPPTATTAAVRLAAGGGGAELRTGRYGSSAQCPVVWSGFPVPDDLARPRLRRPPLLLSLSSSPITSPYWVNEPSARRRVIKALWFQEQCRSPAPTSSCSSLSLSLSLCAPLRTLQLEDERDGKGNDQRESTPPLLSPGLRTRQKKRPSVSGK